MASIELLRWIDPQSSQAERQTLATRLRYDRFQDGCADSMPLVLGQHEQLLKLQTGWEAVDT